MNTWDVAIIGGGIVGQATALALQQRTHMHVVVLEAEATLAAHQSGRNSNVIHSGLYYKPGSLKATLCARGREMMYRFCETHGIPFERCGKIVLACDEDELSRLSTLETRGLANGLSGLQRLSPEETLEYEPNARGKGALRVPDTGITDFATVTATMAAMVKQAGGEVHTNARVVRVVKGPDGFVLHCASDAEVHARHLINCAGAQSDRLARMCGVPPTCHIVPFRGEYFNLTSSRTDLVKNLVYPVPNPALPFLGVHLTRMVRGGVECGPNAVLSFSRSRYGKIDLSARDMFESITFWGFWRMAAKHWRTAIDEQIRSMSRRRFARSLQRLIPAIEADDLEPGHCGIRAQAIDPDGSLVDDFRFVEAEHQLHVLNAPSPAATASLAIGEHIAARAATIFSLRSAAVPAGK